MSNKINNPENIPVIKALENGEVNGEKNMWERFYNIFPELRDSDEFSPEAMSLIESGATPLEAFMLSLLATAFEGLDSFGEEIAVLKISLSRKSTYPGSLKNQHPEVQSDPFIEGIRSIL